MRPGTWKCILLSLCVAVWPAAAYSQTIAKTLDELRLLVKSGDTVAVTDAGGRVTKGAITTLSPSALVLDVNGQPREWKEGDISTISHRRSDSLGDGALWGLIIGAGATATAIAIAVNSEGGSFEEEDLGFALAVIGIYGGAGAAVGVGIDALIKKEQVIYQKGGASSARWQLAPVVTPRVQGARLSVRF